MDEEKKDCNKCEFWVSRNSKRKGVLIPNSFGKCTRDGGHCNPDIPRRGIDGVSKVATGERDVELKKTSEEKLRTVKEIKDEIDRIEGIEKRLKTASGTYGKGKLSGLYFALGKKVNFDGEVME